MKKNKTSDAQLRASKKYKQKNKERQMRYDKKYKAKMFISEADLNELSELERLINLRKEILNNSSINELEKQED